MTDAKTRAKQLRWTLVLDCEQETVIAAAISEAVEEEREACARLVETEGGINSGGFARCIRSRGPASPAPVLDGSACWCSEYQSSGVPCLPGKCPNAPKSAEPAPDALLEAAKAVLAAWDLLRWSGTPRAYHLAEPIEALTLAVARKGE